MNFNIIKLEKEIRDVAGSVKLFLVIFTIIAAFDVYMTYVDISVSKDLTAALKVNSDSRVEFLEGLKKAEDFIREREGK